MKFWTIALAFACGTASVAQAQVGADPRTHIPLQENWSFHKGTLDPSRVFEASTDIQWDPIAIPHTWNNLDGQDGGDNYFKGDGWYRRTLTITPEMQGKQLYLRFEGINRNADFYLNGKKFATHIGGTQAICLD